MKTGGHFTSAQFTHSLLANNESSILEFIETNIYNIHPAMSFCNTQEIKGKIIFLKIASGLSVRFYIQKTRVNDEQTDLGRFEISSQIQCFPLVKNFNCFR